MQTPGNGEIVDLTEGVTSVVRTSGVQRGVAVVFATVLLVRVLTGHPIVIREVPKFLMLLTLDVGLITIVMWLYFRALQVSPLSLCVPFMALTPLFLLPIGALVLHEAISAGMVAGVVLVVLGSLVINRQQFAHGSRIQQRP